MNKTEMAEKLAKKSLEGPFEMPHRDVFADHKSFDLMEEGEVGGVLGIASIATPRGDHLEWRFLVLHVVDLGIRGVRPEEKSLAHKKSVLHVPRGVVGREVQCLKIVIVGLDLTVSVDVVSHPREDCGDFVN